MPTYRQRVIPAMASRYINQRYGDSHVIDSHRSSRATSREPSRCSSRATSISRSWSQSRATSRATSQTRSHTDYESLVSRATSLAPVPPTSSSRSTNKRWSSVIDFSRDRKETPTRMLPDTSTLQPVSTRPFFSGKYTEALIRSSRRLRERSLSPPPRVFPTKVSPYKNNLDYYRGMTKSIYEKEPIFKDFVRNIPLSQSNFYDYNNVSSLKRNFQKMVIDKYPPPTSSRPDPYSPSLAWDRLHQPKSEALSIKHQSAPPGPCRLPFIYVYHRNSRL